MRPQLTFACELGVDALQALFADSSVADDLRALEASVALGILDLSPERAAVARHLNQVGIPLVAWLLLPEEQGYWFNLGNARDAARRYTDFRAWSEEYDLRWSGIGLDIEPDRRELHMLLRRQWGRVLPRLVQRAFDSHGLHQAQAEYGALVARIRADGYAAESYVLPFILDERRVGSTLLRRCAGLVDVPADREVAMLYSSFVRPGGEGILWSYAPDARAIGLGSTGGGVEIEGLGDSRTLDWNEFSRDMRLAQRWSDDLFIFSLEGCVRQGFLSQLRTFDWAAPVYPPLRMARSVDLIRRAFRAILWASTHPYVSIAAVAALVWLSWRRCRHDK
jgi:hypothetical protein